MELKKLLTQYRLRLQHQTVRSDASLEQALMAEMRHNKNLMRSVQRQVKKMKAKLPAE